MKELGWIPQKGSPQVTLIKTFVTSPLQDKIAQAHGVKCINTLTGFKWIGEKLNDYEMTLRRQLNMSTIEYISAPSEKRRELLQQYSTFFAFGCEESYGYLASDNVRDKDAHAAALMICEMLAFLKQSGKSLIDFRNEIFRKYGYYDETQLNVYYEGASGASKIENILESYEKNPPLRLGHFRITRIMNFSKDEISDPDGKRIPSQSFFIVDLDNDYRYAIRGSGTEPKIKFYIFGNTSIDSHETIETAAQKTNQTMEVIKNLLREDIDMRT
jgi:phosphoglucomutase